MTKKSTCKYLAICFSWSKILWKIGFGFLIRWKRYWIGKLLKFIRILFWEGHKILWNLRRRFYRYYIGQVNYQNWQTNLLDFESYIHSFSIFSGSKDKCGKISVPFEVFLVVIFRDSEDTRGWFLKKKKKYSGLHNILHKVDSSSEMLHFCENWQ